MAATQPFLAHGVPAPFGPATGRLTGPAGRALVLLLANRVLARPMEDGLVDFLACRVLAIAISDLGIEWRFTFEPGRNRIVRSRRRPETVIRGDSLALLQLAARRVDPDTLFFRRRLAVEGDTELGLQAKNLLDTLEPEDLPSPLARLLEHAADLAQRWS